MFPIRTLEYHGVKAEKIKINSCDQVQNIQIVRDMNKNRPTGAQRASALCVHEVGKTHGFPVT